MRRDLDEILLSQEKMLSKDQSSEREKFKAIYEQHLKKTSAFFESNEISYLNIWYKELISNTETEIKKIMRFLELSENWEHLAIPVKPVLYRNKK